MGQCRDCDAEVPTAVVVWSHWSVGIHICIVFDRDPSILLPRSGHGLVMVCSLVPSWRDSTRSALPSSRGVRLRVGCHLTRLLGRQVD
jgi:hypothetical protein